MYTLFDFITHVKGVEYLIGLTSILLFILLWEALKPLPFRKLASGMRDDLAYVKSCGMRTNLRRVGIMLTAPVIGAVYVVMLPVAFFFAIAIAAIEGAGKFFFASASFGWRPVEAYLAGKGKKARKAVVKKDSDDDKDTEAKS